MLCQHSWTEKSCRDDGRNIVPRNKAVRKTTLPGNKARLIQQYVIGPGTVEQWNIQQSSEKEPSTYRN